MPRQSGKGVMPPVNPTEAALENAKDSLAEAAEGQPVQSEQTPPAAPEENKPTDEVHTDDGSFDTQPMNDGTPHDGTGDLKGPSMDGVNPNAPTPPAPRLPQTQHKPRKGGTYIEIRANDAARLHEKDEAVRAGKRVEKVGSGYGAVYRIYQ